jgi:hypothetical protein
MSIRVLAPLGRRPSASAARRPSLTSVLVAPIVPAPAIQPAPVLAPLHTSASSEPAPAPAPVSPTTSASSAAAAAFGAPRPAGAPVETWWGARPAADGAPAGKLFDGPARPRGARAGGYRWDFEGLEGGAGAGAGGVPA